MSAKPGLYRSYRHAARSLAIALAVSLGAALVAIVLIGALSYAYIKVFG